MDQIGGVEDSPTEDPKPINPPEARTVFTYFWFALMGLGGVTLALSIGYGFYLSAVGGY